MTKAEILEELRSLKAGKWTDKSADAIAEVLDVFFERDVFETSEIEGAAEHCRWKIEDHCSKDDNGNFLYSAEDIENAFKEGSIWEAGRGYTIEGETYGNPCVPDDFYYTGNTKFWHHLKWNMPQHEKFLVQIKSK